MEIDQLQFSFHFLEAWTLDPGCSETVKKIWCRKVDGIESFKLAMKLCNTQPAHFLWNRVCFGHCQTLLNQLEFELKEIQRQPFLDGTIQCETELQSQIETFLDQLDSIWI